MKGIVGLTLGTLFGVAVTVAAYTYGLSLASPEKILDLRARIDEQAREIESQRREIATQAEALRTLDPLKVATALPNPRESRPVSPPFAPLPAPGSLRNEAPAPTRQSLEFDYADLINDLHLSAAQRLTFLELLARRSQPGTDAALRAFFPQTAEYTTFKTYTRQLPERRSVRELRVNLERRAQPLTPEQETALIALFGRERKALQFPADAAAFDAAIAANPSAATRLLQDHARLTQRILNRAAEILAPGQIEILRQFQSNEFQRLNLSVQMAQPPPK